MEQQKQGLNIGIKSFITAELDTKCKHFGHGDILLTLTGENKPDIAKAVKEKNDDIKAYVVNKGMKELTFHLGDLTDDEREIILKGCLINYNRR